MSLILPANSLTGGYEIDNSLRFEDSSTDYLSRTLSSNNTSATTMTFSWWHKVGEENDVNWVYTSNTTDPKWFRVGRAGVGLFVYYRDASFTNQMNVVTNPVYRDSSAWYHFIVVIDTTQATASNRVKMYVNGVEITSFSSAVYPSQNYTFDNVMYTSGNDVNIGRSYVNNTPTQFFSGYLSEYYFIDGQALTPTDFGEFDEDTGIWKPIEYTGTYGNNGFYLDFENSGSLGADQSGNGNNFTVNNLTSIDQVTDTPTNNFATLNGVSGYGTFAEGNLQYTTTTTDGEWSTSTISISTGGKWYCETKMISITGGAQYQVGVSNINSANFTYRVVYRGDGAIYVGGSSIDTFSSYTTNDIIGMAYDASTRQITFYKNGVSQGTVTAPALPSGGDYFFGATSLSGGNTFVTQWNFGNPPFTISSGNSDANGYGNFEYAVPSGYYSLCTKNLAEFG